MHASCPALSFLFSLNTGVDAVRTRDRTRERLHTPAHKTTKEHNKKVRRLVGGAKRVREQGGDLSTHTGTLLYLSEGRPFNPLCVTTLYLHEG